MNVCVDVGNSTTIVGLYENDSLIERLSLTTDLIKTEDEYLTSINTHIASRKIDINKVTNIIFSSVVPSLNRPLKGALMRAFNTNSIISIVPGIKTGIPLKVDNPNEVGNDLIADLVGAKEKYGYPTLIIDLGTASKILLIDDKGNFSSCNIMPGLYVSADSLYKKAALLPSVALEKSDSVIAKNTISAMNTGIVMGHAEMIKGMANRYEKELGYKLTKVITGGASELVKDILNDEFLFDPTLVLDGLNMIIRRNSNEK